MFIKQVKVFGSGVALRLFPRCSSGMSLEVEGGNIYAVGLDRGETFRVIQEPEFEPVRLGKLVGVYMKGRESCGVVNVTLHQLVADVRKLLNSSGGKFSSSRN